MNRRIMTPEGFMPAYARTRAGLIHHVAYGDGPPVVLLHQAPGSWDEFRLLMPLLSGRTAIAVDLVGFGCSELIEDHSIERYADATLALLEHLDLTEVDVVGHKLGGIVAIEAAAQDAARLRRLVVSGTPYVDEEYRQQRSALHPLSLVELQDDGRHLNELWVRRSGFYPPARPDLLNRYVREVLWLDDQAEEAHNAISRYHMEGRTTFGGPVLCLAATADPWYDQVNRLADRLAQAKVIKVPGGTVPLMEQMPQEVAALVNDFLAE
jgi:pimeloyl-ACP methyl ester carboxylesterase